MFICSIKLSNFKGFIGENHKIEFNVPNGNLGSGLNIFVGENNSGKSTVFEAVNFLRNGCKEDSIHLVKSKLEDKTQPENSIVEIEFCGNVQSSIVSFVPDNKQNAFLSLIYEEDKLKAKRSTESVKKLFLWNGSEYSNPSGIDAPFKTLFETNFIWADTNPNDEASFGSTTLCGLLLKEIAQAHINTAEYQEFQDKFNQVFNDPNSGLRQEISIIEQRVKSIFSEQFGNAEIYFKFDELKIDSFFKNTSIFINDGVDIPMTEKGNGMQRSIALALLQVYAEQLAYDKTKGKAKPFYLFIDEPELCLHPKGQSKLFNALLEISKNQQVFLTTHSPYFLSSPYLKNIGLFLFKKDGVGNLVENANLDPMFPWSPTWGEINFKAYNLPTVELHNELYGCLQYASRKFSEKEFDKWLQENGITASKLWVRENKGEPNNPMNVTLQTFVRNHIHHPENKTMKENMYTEDELYLSVEGMIELLKSLTME